LVLYVRQLGGGELVFIRSHLLLTEVPQESHFALQNENEGFTATFGSYSGSADSVNIIFRIIWRVKLDDPVNFREVEATLSDIRA